MHVCHHDGYLVGPRLALPADPTDLGFDGLPVVGCNRLRCRQCGVEVRNAAGLALVDKPSPDALYGQSDLASSPHVKADAAVRLYVCRCHLWQEASSRPLNDPDPEPFQAPNIPWGCAGHPAIEFPHDLDGQRVAGEPELSRVVVAALHGQLPPAVRPEDRPRTVWLARLHRRLAGTPSSGVVAQAALAALEDPDASVRARALQLFFSLGLPDGARRAFDLYQRDRAAFTAPDPVTQVRGDTTLEDTLWRLADPLIPAGGPVRDLARAEAVAPGRGRRALYSALAATDADWVLAHLEEIVKATPALAKDFAAICSARMPPTVNRKMLRERLSSL